MSDYVISLIRTYVPLWIAAGVAWLNQHLGPIDISPELGVLLAAAIASVYYAAARTLEQKYPRWGWLLGKRTVPTYRG